MKSQESCASAAVETLNHPQRSQELIRLEELVQCLGDEVSVKAEIYLIIATMIYYQGVVALEVNKISDYLLWAMKVEANGQFETEERVLG